MMSPALWAAVGKTRNAVSIPRMLAYWPLDEESGGRADWSGNEYDLTDINSVLFNAAKVGNGALFDNTETQALVAANASEATALAMGTGSFTYFGIYQAKSVHGVSTYGGLVDSPANFAMYEWDGATLEYNLYAGGPQGLTSAALVDGEWYFLYLGYDAKKRKQQFGHTHWDNRNIEGYQYSQVIAADRDNATPFDYFKLGAWGGDEATYISCASVMDEWGCCNKALSEKQLQKIYNRLKKGMHIVPEPAADGFGTFLTDEDGNYLLNEDDIYITI